MKGRFSFMDIELFDYDLPEELIAQTPLKKRDTSRLMVLDKETGDVEHKHFYDILDYLKPGDVLVRNNTKVIPARLYGLKEETGGHVEVLLLKDLHDDLWECLVGNAKIVKLGTVITFGDGRLKAQCTEIREEGIRIFKMIYDGIFYEILDQLGIMPLPPYIKEKLNDPDRYQTVYAKVEGSAAAPTAGLHFTEELLQKVREKGVEILDVTLHVGLGTFRPVKVENVLEHHMHSEYYEISEEVAEKLNQAKKDGIVDVILDGIDEQLKQCDLIFLCTPVEYNAQYLSKIRSYLKPGALITDVGSTKTDIHKEILRQGLTDCFVGGHPMAGSEKTGYENATDHLLENAYYIVTPPEGFNQNGCGYGNISPKYSENVKRIIAVAQTVGAIPLVLDYKEHDTVVAAISHLPHLVASSLVNLVKDSDSPAETMKQVAAGGFKDITRIASSSPEMWEQICMTNSEPIADMLERYIDSLQDTLSEIKGHQGNAIYKLFEKSRDYRNTITDRAKGSVEPSYAFSVDMADEVGAISTIAVILAAKGISIKNIGINNNRERGEGTLKIEFYDEAAMTAAWKRLEYYKYEMVRL